MNIPGFINIKFVGENGFLTNEMQLYNDNLNQELQKGLSDNGWTTPSVNDNAITTASAQMPNGTFWYDNVNHEIVFKVNGALVKLVTAVYP